MKHVIKIIGFGKDHRPCEHDTGLWLDQDGVTVEYDDGTRKQFYVSQMLFSGDVPVVEPVDTVEKPAWKLAKLTKEMVEIGEEAIDEGLRLRLDGDVDYVTGYMFVRMTGMYATKVMVDAGERTLDDELTNRAPYCEGRFDMTLCEVIFNSMIRADSDFYERFTE